MDTVTVNTLRTNMAKVFDEIDSGKEIVVRRKKRLYLLTRFDNEEQTISSELQAKIDRVRQEYKNGNYIRCSTKEDLHTLLDSL